MHWQRPATLEWPSINERAEILHLQKSLTPTTPDELPDRIITVQRWQDVLMLEGMDFFPNARCENSFDKVDPWYRDVSATKHFEKEILRQPAENWMS